MKYFLQYLCTAIVVFACISCDSNPTDPTTEKSYPIKWQGADSVPPLSPEENWVYFNTKTLTSYIWSGTVWDTMTISGLDGISIQWLGSLPQSPPTPVKNQAFFNTSDQVSYVFNGTQWDTLSCSGEKGFSFEWKGSLATAPINPKYLWAYFNTTDQTTYQFNGTEWEIVALKGLQGTEIIWKGTFEEEPLDAQENWAYYNSIHKTSYVFDGIDWKIMAIDGTKGAKGLSVIWLGTQSVVPPYPEKNMAYYNPKVKTSYIFNGTGWDVFVVSGKDGLSVIWHGSLEKAPENPIKNWAYYNTIDKCSYIFNGSDWCIMCKDGKSGVDGVSINWQGSKYAHPATPQKNWAYYNYTEGKTYLYNGLEWVIICVDGQDGEDGKWGKDGEDGEDGDTTHYSISGNLPPGDSLHLIHNQNSDHLSFIGNYTSTSGNIYNWYTKDPQWKNPYEKVFDTLLYKASSSNQEFLFFKRNDGSLLHVFIEKEDIYKGGKYATLSENGELGTIYSFVNAHIKDLSVHEDANNNLIFTYINEDKNNAICATIISPDGSSREILLYELEAFKLSTTIRKNGNLFLSYINNDTVIECNEMLPDFTLQTPFTYGSSLSSFYSDIHLLEKRSGELVLQHSKSVLHIKDRDNITVSEIDISRIQSYSPLREDLNGKLYIIARYYIGGGKYTRVYCCLIRLSSDGIEEKRIDLGRSYFGDPIVLNNGNICYSTLSYRTVSGKGGSTVVYDNTKISTVNSDLENVSSTYTDLQLSDEQFIETADNQLLIVSDKFYRYGDEKDILFTKLKVSDKIPGFSLNVISRDEASLVNNTGYTLNAKLAIILGNRGGSNE